MSHNEAFPVVSAVPASPIHSKQHCHRLNHLLTCKH